MRREYRERVEPALPAEMQRAREWAWRHGYRFDVLVELTPNVRGLDHAVVMYDRDGNIVERKSGFGADVMWQAIAEAEADLAEWQMEEMKEGARPNRSLMRRRFRP